MPNKIQIITNYQKAVEVSKIVISMLEKKVWPFSQTNLFPDAIVPKNIKSRSLEHALFLFYAVALDSRRESRVTYPKVRTLAEYLDFSKIEELRTGYVKKMLIKYFESPIEKASGNPIETFMRNARKLNKEYHGDPRNIKAETVDETLKRIKKFYAYGKTNNALFMKNMVKAEIWDFPHDSFPIKIDRHAINISIGTGVVQLPLGLEKIRFEKLVNPLKKVYLKAINQENISAIDLNNAFWAIGQYICTPRQLAHCEMNCPLNCKIKPYTDKEYTIIQLNKEIREPTNNLFSK